MASLISIHFFSLLMHIHAHIRFFGSTNEVKVGVGVLGPDLLH